LGIIPVWKILPPPWKIYPPEIFHEKFFPVIIHGSKFLLWKPASPKKRSQENSNSAENLPLRVPCAEFIVQWDQQGKKSQIKNILYTNSGKFSSCKISPDKFTPRNFHPNRKFSS
jgi:hypothetical protein